MERIQRARVCEDDVGARGFGGLGGLGVDAQDGVCFAQTAGLHEATDLGCTRRGDDPDGIAVGGPAGFDEFDGVDDGDGGYGGAATGEGCQPVEDVLTDDGVDEVLEACELDRIGKHDGTEGFAVEGAVGKEDARAESRHDGVVDRLAGLLQVAGDGVGVDGVDPRVGEGLDDGAFAAGDIAGQADDVSIVVRHIRV